MAWDRHNFLREVGASEVGIRVGDESEMRAGEEDVNGFYAKDAQEMGVGPFGATTDEDPNQVQNDDVGTKRNKSTRGD